MRESHPEGAVREVPKLSKPRKTIMAFTGTSRGKLPPRTHDQQIIRTEKKLAEAKNNNRPEMVEMYERQLAALR